MKVLLCSNCMDIRAMHPHGKPTSCRCGEVTAWWTDSHRRTAKFYAPRKEFAWMIGLHNGFLAGALARQGMRTPEFWRELHDEITSTAHGYVFHDSQRKCWAAPFKPGWTNDVTWATFDELQHARDQIRPLEGEL
jgi:hypothetical protein